MTQDTRPTTKSRKSWVLVPLLCCCLAGVNGVRAEGRAHLHLYSQGLGDEIDRLFARLEGGDLDNALHELQEQLESALERGSLLRVASRRGVYSTYRPAADEIARRLEAQPAPVIAAYRRLFDVAANVSYQRVLETHDPHQLVECRRRFPISSAASPCGLLAGEMFLERGDRPAAARAWRSVPWALLDAEETALLKRRRQLLARAEEAAPHPAAHEYRELDLTDRISRRSWPRPVTLEDGRRPPSLGEQVDYATVPVVAGDSVVVAGTHGISRANLATGQITAHVSLPHYAYYVEPSPYWRNEPAVFGDLAVTCYVVRANHKQGRGRRSGVIKASVPQRALSAVTLKRGAARILWRSSEAEDERVRRLSFNSPPRIHAGRVYALGWEESGYVTAWLVAFDLETGQPLWKTLVVSNQVEQTRFGELAEEPRLGELIIEGDTLFAATNLGVVTAVRLHDGHTRWVTEYLPVRSLLTIGDRRRLSYPYQSRIFWERCSVVPLDDRIVVTPQDSSRAFSFHRETGHVLQRRSTGRGRPNFLLGSHGDDVYFCSSRRVLRVPGKQLAADGVSYYFEKATRTRPVLVDGGVIYATPDSLKALTFEETPTRHTLGYLRSRPVVDGGDGRRRGFRVPRSELRDGTLVLAGKRVLVANSARVEAYELMLLK